MKDLRSLKTNSLAACTRRTPASNSIDPSLYLIVSTPHKPLARKSGNRLEPKASRPKIRSKHFQVVIHTEPVFGQ